jgi:hypothetical protein
MFRLTLSYVRYALTAMSTVAFKLSANEVATPAPAEARFLVEGDNHASSHPQLRPVRADRTVHESLWLSMN